MFDMTRYVRWLYPLLILLLASPSFAQRWADADAVSAWLERAAVPLMSLTPSSGFNDLWPLARVLDGVRLVGLGESTHGTREFFTLKHRLLEFLVAELGVTAFLIEASYPASLAVNNYVLYGKGDLGEVLRGLGFWMYDTEEMASLVGWLREHNQGVPEAQKVSFLGVDFQHAGTAPGRVRAFLEDYLPDQATRFEPTLVRLRLRDELTTDAATLTEVLPQLRQLVAALEAHEAALVRETSPRAYRRVLLHARVLVQHAVVYREGGFDAAARNRFMAENALALMADTPSGTRAVIWAHNVHVAKTPAETGIHLERALGKRYYALGLSFGQGTFQAREYTDAGLGGVRAWTVGAAPEDTHDWFFARPRLGSYAVNFRRTPADLRVRRWLGSFRPLRWAGCVASKRIQRNWSESGSFPSVRLDQAFDGLVFVPSTTRARPNLPISLDGTVC